MGSDTRKYKHTSTKSDLTPGDRCCLIMKGYMTKVQYQLGYETQCVNSFMASARFRHLLLAVEGSPKSLRAHTVCVPVITCDT